MIDVSPRKPRVIIETMRDEYAIKFVLRHRKPWTKLPVADRQRALLEGADALDELAQQMRDEAMELAVN